MTGARVARCPRCEEPGYHPTTDACLAALAAALEREGRRTARPAGDAGHVPRYWLLLTPDEARALAAGRVPDPVRQMARRLDADPFAPPRRRAG